MSDSHAQDDAARPEESPFIETPDDRTAGGGARPGGLVAICMVTILLAALGLLTGCAGLASHASQARLRQAIAKIDAGKGDERKDKVQQEFNDRIFAITDRYRWATLPLLIAKTAVEIGLLAGAILSLQLKRSGRSWLLGALIAAIVVESLYAVPVMLIQNETRKATTEMMGNMMAAGPGGKAPPPGVQDFAETFGSIVGIFAIAYAVGWLLAKIVFYMIAIRYLRKLAIVSLFEAPAEEPSA
jgi:hypothetical protein